MGDYLGGTLIGAWGAMLTVPGSIAALSSGNIVVKIAGVGLVISGSILAYCGLTEDTIYQDCPPHKLAYKGLKGLYNKIKR